MKENEKCEKLCFKSRTWMSLSEAVTFAMCPSRQAKRQGMYRMYQKGAGGTGSAGILGKH